MATSIDCVQTKVIYNGTVCLTVDEKQQIDQLCTVDQFSYCNEKADCVTTNSTNVLVQCTDHRSSSFKTLYCICDKTRLAAAVSSTTQEPTDSGGLSPGVTAVIIIFTLIGLIALAAIAIFLIRKLRHNRKNKGKYQPQAEELEHNRKNKDLPYLPPPNIEGLI